MSATDEQTGAQRMSGRDSAEPAGERQVPFYCPYCGDEDLRPAGPAAGSWRCGACARAFELRFAGIAPGGGPGPAAATVAGDTPGGGPRP